jgi:hypothetical protein
MTRCPSEASRAAAEEPIRPLAPIIRIRKARTRSWGEHRCALLSYPARNTHFRAFAC